jgi:anaerobic magnesium-protoporphyrin IX monomethyl ester cyclase
MDVTLISPNIVTQKGDFFGSGIPYMPFTVAYLAGYLTSKKHTIHVIDAFGANPTKVTEQGGHFVQGLTSEEVTKEIPRKTKAICISAERVIGHNAILMIIKAIRNTNNHKNTPITIIENTQAVSAYALKHVYKEFFDVGADYVLTGEPEYRTVQLLDALQKKTKETQQDALRKVDGIIIKGQEEACLKRKEKKKKQEFIKELDALPFPTWRRFPLENYWDLNYAHAPLTSNKYLPLLTSRGCPFPCGFCVVPTTNGQRWRSRSAKNVVDEIEHLIKIFNVGEFHLEDLNPTIRKERMQEISKEIIKRNLKISWKIGSGTKIETVDEETLTIMAKAGCTFLSFSPESGSPEVLKRMRKPFPHKRALELTKYMNKLNITTQACFVLGYPGETKKDRKMTLDYIKALARSGCDEIALFVMAPVPGSSTYPLYKKKLEEKNKEVSLQEMSFSPRWRDDFAFYEQYRKKGYRAFMITKLLHYPKKVLLQPINIFTKRFNTKMEMTIYRLAKTYLLNIQRKIAQHRNTIILFWIIGAVTSYFIIRALDILKYIGRL